MHGPRQLRHIRFSMARSRLLPGINRSRNRGRGRCAGANSCASDSAVPGTASRASRPLHGPGRSRSFCANPRTSIGQTREEKAVVKRATPAVSRTQQVFRRRTVAGSVAFVIAVEEPLLPMQRMSVASTSRITSSGGSGCASTNTSSSSSSIPAGSRRSLQPAPVGSGCSCLPAVCLDPTPRESSRSRREPVPAQLVVVEVRHSPSTRCDQRLHRVFDRSESRHSLTRIRRCSTSRRSTPPARR